MNGLIAAALILVQGMPNCGKRADILGQLQRAGLEVVARAVVDEGDLMKVAASPDGAMAVVLTYPDGIVVRGNSGTFTFPPNTTCVIANGDGWQTVTPGAEV